MTDTIPTYIYFPSLSVPQEHHEFDEFRSGQFPTVVLVHRCKLRLKVQLLVIVGVRFPFFLLVNFIFVWCAFAIKIREKVECHPWYKISLVKASVYIRYAIMLPLLTMTPINAFVIISISWPRNSWRNRERDIPQQIISAVITLV